MRGTELEAYSIKFQGKVLDEYDRIVEEFGLEVIDAVASITDQQRLVRSLVTRHVHGAEVEIIDEQQPV